MENLKGSKAGKALLVVFFIALATIVGAWGFEVIGGYKPCPLCLTQRWSYYIGVPLAAIMLVAMWQNMLGYGALRTGLGVLALIFLVGGGLGAYHAGVEWGFWPGPTSCTGGAGISGGLPDLTKKVVQCDEVQLRILGLSFAGWNAVVSWSCALVAVFGMMGKKS